MYRALSLIDRFNRFVGRAVSWLTGLMVLIGALVVFIRYAMHQGSAALQEAMIYMHGTVFLCAAAYALSENAHVRIDFIYEHLSARKRAWIDLLGTIFLLIPFALAILILSQRYVLNSWEMLEGSADLRGLPGVFIMKTLIWVFAIMLLLQAAVQIGKCIKVIQGHAELTETPAAVE